MHGKKYSGIQADEENFPVRHKHPPPKMVGAAWDFKNNFHIELGVLGLGGSL